MPTHKSAVKRIRTSQKKHARNIAIKSDLYTILKKVNALITAKNVEGAKKAIQQAISKLDRAATKKIIHRKKSSRNKSRLTKKLNKLTAA